MSDTYDMPWRPTYEAYSAAGWALSTIGIATAAAFANIPSSYALYMGTCSVIGMAYRGWQTKKHWDFKVALSGRKFFVLPMQELVDVATPSHMWLGKGWEWQPVHTQRCYEALKRDIKDFFPPDWILKLKGIPLQGSTSKKVMAGNIIGAPWIHGLEAKEADIFVKREAIEGHTLVVGTTGAGKTRLLETVTTQYILNGIKNNDCTIIIDPKGDKELAEIAKTACAVAGHPERFITFHPAFPQQSVRLDPLKNWSRKTQVASRISMLMDGGGNESFKQFAWRAVNVVAEGLLYIGQRPNLKLIKQYVAGGPDDLMEAVLERFFTLHMPGWESLTLALIAEVRKAKAGSFPTKLPSNARPELIAYIHFYKNQVPIELRDDSVNGLLELTEHPREHYGKVITNVLPILTMLTSDEIGRMLSPDAEDIEDERPIFDSGKIIEGGYCLYMGLDSLSDATVGSALAGIVLADLAAKAGEIYNYGEKSDRRVNLIVDEASEVVNPPMIQLLNKGRGSGFVIWLLTQTFPDFIAKMGDEAQARQILGNCNNLIALRCIDTPTQEFITERFGKTFIKQVNTSFTGGSRSNDVGMAQTSGVSQSTSETEVDVVPPTILGRLPAMNYIALLAGGTLIKGRLPKLSMEKD